MSEIEGAITSLILVRFGHALYGWKGNFMLISNQIEDTANNNAEIGKFTIGGHLQFGSLG